MRYLKRQSTNKRLLNGKGLIYTQFENIEAQSVGAFLVPKAHQHRDLLHQMKDKLDTTQLTDS